MIQNSSPKIEFSRSTIEAYKKIFLDFYPVSKEGKRIVSKASRDFDNMEAYIRESEYRVFEGHLREDIIVIDIDNKDEHYYGSISWKNYLRNIDKERVKESKGQGKEIEYKLEDLYNLESPTTFSHRTKSGGYHLYFSIEPFEKERLKNRIGKYIEIKKERSYIAGSYIEDFEGKKGGLYSIHSEEEVKRLDIAILLELLKPRCDKTIKDYIELDWEYIDYNEVVERFKNWEPNSEYHHWLCQMYRFITVYEMIRVKQDIVTMDSCEEILQEWSKKGSNAGPNDYKIVKGIVNSFDINKNIKYLDVKNNSLLRGLSDKYEDKEEEELKTEFEKEVRKIIIYFNNIKSQQKNLENELQISKDVLDKEDIEKIYKKMNALEKTKEKHIIAQFDKLAKGFVQDINNYTDYFMLDINKKEIHTLYGFTINHKWETIFNNATRQITTNRINYIVLCNILDKDNCLLYDGGILRKYLNSILYTIELENKFASHIFARISLEINPRLCPKKRPLDIDIMVFKNTAIKITKEPFSIKPITWEELRSYKLLDSPVLSLAEKHDCDFEEQQLIFDKKTLDIPLEEIEEDIYILFAPLFYDFSYKIMDLNKESEDLIIRRTKDRMRAFFSCIGKGMLRYKSGILPMFFILSGSEDSSRDNGGNGKSLLLEQILPCIFGVNTLHISKGMYKKTRFSNVALVDRYLSIIEDPGSEPTREELRIMELIKEVGERSDIVENKGKDIKHKKLFNDIIFVANTISRNLSLNESNRRRIAYLMLHNSLARAYKYTCKKYTTLLENYKNFLETQEEWGNAEDQILRNSERILWKIYNSFFELYPAKNGDLYNIFHLYCDTLYREFYKEDSCNLLRTKIFIYCFTLGDKLLKQGSFSYLTGLDIFKLEDANKPFYNLLVECITVYETTDKIGFLITYDLLRNFLKKAFRKVVFHEAELEAFLKEVPKVKYTSTTSFNTIKNYINIKVFNLGLFYQKLEIIKEIRVTPNREFQTDITELNKNLLLALKTKDVDNILKGKIKLICLLGIDKNDDICQQYLANNNSLETNWLCLNED